MKSIRVTSFVLLILLCAGCGRHAADPSRRPSSPELEVVEEYWPDGGLMQRKQVLRQSDGTLIDHGTFERWHKNGRKEYEAVFVYGKKEGTTTRWHANGRKSSQQEYRDGRRHGLSIAWNPAGEKVTEESWENGRPHGTWTVWKHGEIRWRNRFEHGVPVSVAQVDERP